MHPEIILAMSIDAIIEEARKDTNKNNKYTLIGKKYTVKDNSFTSELVEGKRLDYHVGLIGVPVTIVSKPYLTTITKPVIGSPTITITSTDGFILRQDAKYTHGSSATEHAIPSSIKGSLGNSEVGGIVVTASFNTTTNSLNNDSIGINAQIKVAFS